MSGGVSVGWFDPVALTPSPDYFAQALLRSMPKMTKAWPLRVSSITKGGEGVGVAYCVVGGHIPIHIDQVGHQDSDGRIFQFVVKTWNRPVLLTAPASEANSKTALGISDDDVPTIGIGGIELKAGQSVHFDITTHFHGVTQFPIGPKSDNVELPPRAVIVQVSGFDPHQIGLALQKAGMLIAEDRAFWDKGGVR